jgi:thermostable 8-oxoguanine DNA glycosylase
MYIPNGFSNLVEIVEEAFLKPPIVKSDDYMWSRFFWTALISGDNAEAEVNYVYNLLDEYLLADIEFLNDKWIERSLMCLKDNQEKAEEPNLRGKIAAIHKIEVEIPNIYRTLTNANSVFENMRMDSKYLQNIAGKYEEEQTLLAKIASKEEVSAIKSMHNSNHPNKIWGIAYTKAVLWLKGCGVAHGFIPNNKTSMKFLKQCDKSWTNDDFFVVNSRFNLICKHLNADPYYAGLALWYYETTKNLVSRKKSQFYSPEKLIRIMESNSMDIDDISTYLSDIELLEELKEILNLDSCYI